MDRHGRQARLAEVGAAGQARIERATVDVRLDGLAADVAARYLAGAGVQTLRVRETVVAEAARTIAPALRVEVEPAMPVAATLVPEGAGVADPTAREVFRGALVALRSLRAILEESR